MSAPRTSRASWTEAECRPHDGAEAAADRRGCRSRRRNEGGARRNCLLRPRPAISVGTLSSRGPPWREGRRSRSGRRRNRPPRARTEDGRAARFEATNAGLRALAAAHVVAARHHGHAGLRAAPAAAGEAWAAGLILREATLRAAGGHQVGVPQPDGLENGTMAAVGKPPQPTRSRDEILSITIWMFAT